MLNDNFYCVLMAGGHGDKLWPWSREKCPKQFTSIGQGGVTMLRLAYERCLGLVPDKNIIVATVERYQDLVRDLIPELPEENLLLEPIAKHTAPCTVYSTYTLIKRNPEAVVAMIPADNIIDERELFISTMERAMAYASTHDILMALGVIPNRPDPNYGYIQVVGGKAVRNSDKPAKVKTFTEKPDTAIAEVFCKSDEFFWNSGIFIWKASVIREECEEFMPSITNLFQGWEDVLGTPEESSFIHKAYADCPKLSIDYGVMEKTSRAWIYPIKFKWMDLDNWIELYDTASTIDEYKNLHNTSHSIIKDTSNSIILSENRGKLLAIRGLKDYVVVDTDDVLLICPRNNDDFNDLTSAIGFPDYEKFR